MSCNRTVDWEINRPSLKLIAYQHKNASIPFSLSISHLGNSFGFTAARQLGSDHVNVFRERVTENGPQGVAGNRN